MHGQRRGEGGVRALAALDLVRLGTGQPIVGTGQWVRSSVGRAGDHQTDSPTPKPPVVGGRPSQSSQPPNLILRSPRLPPSGNVFERNLLRALDPATDPTTTNRVVHRISNFAASFAAQNCPASPFPALHRLSPRARPAPRPSEKTPAHQPAAAARSPQPLDRPPASSLQPPASAPGPASLSPPTIFRPLVCASRFFASSWLLTPRPRTSLPTRPSRPPPSIARSCHRATPRSPPSNPRASPRAHRCRRCCNTSAPPPHALLYRSFGGAGGLSPAPDPERWSTQNPTLQPGSSPSKLLSHPERGQTPTRCCGSTLRSTSCLPSHRRGTMLTPSIKGVLETREMSRTLPKVQPSPAIRASQLVSIFKHAASLLRIADRSSSRHYLNGRV